MECDWCRRGFECLRLRDDKLLARGVLVRTGSGSGEWEIFSRSV